ncbi:MAG: conserved repeat domain protein [Ramlibacter sp.]|nr:conserved repeat domain protein [Ramlibacter sp.]
MANTKRDLIGSVKRGAGHLVACMAFFVSGAQAQSIHFNDLSKAPPDVVEKAKMGVSQDLNVVLDSEAIYRRAAEKRRGRGLQFSDQQSSDETAAELGELKAGTFPGGRLGDAIVLEDHKHVAVLFVRVPNFSALARIIADPRVVAVEPNKVYVPWLGQSLPLIGQPSALSGGKTGAGYRVAVLDSGANFRYPSFNVDLSSGYGCRFKGDAYLTGPYIGEPGCRLSNAINFQSGDSFGEVDPNMPHGSNVALIVAAVAPGAKIDALRVMYKTADGKVNTDTTAVKRAMDWVLANYSKPPGRIVAINLSFGSVLTHSSKCSSTYSEYFNSLRDKDIMPVVASGNEGATNGISDPACANGAIAVGAVYDANLSYAQSYKNYSGASLCTDTTTAADKVGCFSNSSSLISLLAPGARISTEGLGFAGTSQAAPHVAGAAAVLQQAFPSNSLNDIVLRMTSSGKTITDPRSGIRKPRLNLSAALATTSIGDGGGTTTPGAVAAVNAVLGITLVE